MIQTDGRAAPMTVEPIQISRQWLNLKAKTSGLLQEGEQLVKKIGGVFAFNVKDGPGGETARWVVDVKSGQGSVSVDPGMCGCCCPLTHMQREPRSPPAPSTTSSHIELCICFYQK